MKQHDIVFQDYNMDNLELPSNLRSLVPTHNIAHTIHEVVERIPMSTFLPYYSGGGRPPFHPKMMMKVILYAYTQKIYHGREMERQLEVHLPLMWLSGLQKPDFRSINRFRSERMKDLIDDVFREILMLLVEDGYIKLEDYFVDGTKIEANANRYTFVWRKSTEKFREKLRTNVDLLLKQIDGIVEEEQDMEETQRPPMTTERIAQKTAEWEGQLEREPNNKELKKAVKKMKEDYLPRSAKYDNQLRLCGERNSYSKTDPDATFMRMKEDHMKNGQLKPAYNMQVASSDQFILAYSTHQRPGDTRCLLSHLETAKEKFGIQPKRLVADAGYGSEENYVRLEEKGIQAFVKYSSYEKEQTRAFRKHPHHQQNWTYDEESDAWICANGKRLEFITEKRSKTTSGYESINRYYQCQDCEGCPFRADCTSSQYGRTTQFSPVYQEQKQKVRERFQAKEGRDLYRKRKTEVESVFGQIKQNRGFRRLVLRGLPKISIEWGLICVAHNLLKKAAKDRRDKRIA